MIEWWIGIGVLVVLLLMMYRIVPPQAAHFVTAPWGTKVCSPDKNVGKSRWYFRIPILMTVRRMDVTIKELVVSQETYERNQARYNVKSSIKYRIRNVTTAANTFIHDKALQEQLQEVVRASVRAITVKYDVVEARANKQKMSEEITNEITDDLEKWGLELVNFQLIDFQDTDDSSIISDISKRREKEIEAKTREEVAEKDKSARMKEAEAEERAKEREIAKDKIIGERDQEMKQAIAEKERIAREKEFEVKKVEVVKGQQIEKARAIVEAEQKKEQETIFKEQKQLEGQGDRLKAEEQAKGEAAPIREKGFAEAEAKEKLQAALNKFRDEAIRALVAEKVVAMQEKVGVETAGALKEADLRVFAGNDAAQQGFDLGALVSSVAASNDSTAQAIMNRLARPNDLGLSQLDFKDNKQLNKSKNNPSPRQPSSKQGSSKQPSGKQPHDQESKGGNK